MNQFSIENSSQNNISKENQIDFQRLYSQTLPINHLQTDQQETNNNFNNSEHIYQTSTVKNLKLLKNDTNNNIPTITQNETSLVKNLQFLDEDNIKLREAMSELNLELKEKGEALNESQKLLRKINDEYTQMVKEFKKLEEERNLYYEENEKNKKMLENMNKNFNEYDKIVKQNEQLKSELIKNKEIMNNLKGNYTNVTNDFNKIEKDNKIKELIINDLKIEGNKIVNMLQDRDLLIESYSKKISELNGIIKQKDEQLKLMINFSKEINNGNKNNVKEITKQAVKTIKVFYNIRNNKDSPNQINFVEIIKNEKDNNLNKNNISDIIFGNFSNTVDKKIKCGFLLNEAIQNVLYIPDIGINHINKEFLIDNNFKTCLLKTELFSSIIRETEFNSFLTNFISKLNEGISNFNSPLFNNKEEKSKKYEDIIKNFSNLKIYFDKINRITIKYKKENNILKTKLQELILYIIKLKKDFSEKNEKFKEKMKNLDKNYNLYINKLEEKYKNRKDEEDKDTPLDDKGKKEISKLYLEIDKTKNMNDNLSQEIKDKEEIINKLKNENNQLLIKLNAFRTNPNAENNFKYYNSVSINDNNKKGNNKLSRNIHIQNNMNLSDISNYNDIKYNTNKVSFSNNDFFFDNSLNENLSNNSIKYSTKATSKNLSKNKKKIRNILGNFNDLSNNNFNENDITNIFIKSNNTANNSFINLQIESIESFNYILNEKNAINKDINKNMKGKNSTPFEQEILKNIFTLINEFKSEIKEEKFIELTNKNFQIPKIIQLLISKIEDIKSNLSNIKDKFKNNHKDKKIKPSHLIEIMEQVEKLLLYVNNHLNKTNNDMQVIHPYMKTIFDLVSKLAYDSPLSYYNNTCDITPITIGINTLQDTSTININNNKNTIKDNILKNNKITNQEIEDIANTSNNSEKTKESLFPNFQELKQFFNINKKIFSSSELIKYRNIYEGLPSSKILKVFKDICDNLKKTINNTKNEYDSDWSDGEESHIETKNSEIASDNNSYHLVNQKIFGLKKFEFNYKIFMELIKNYLVTFEIIVNQIEIEINNENKEKQIKLGEKLNILYNIFEDAVYYKMDKLDDDIIFNRKILLKLLLNHKEYISIMYDI